MKMPQATLFAGFNTHGSRRVVIYCEEPSKADYFRDTRFADECNNAPRDVRQHRGWYTDTEFCDETLRGVVARLPHGRFIAGYASSDSGMRVWYPESLDSEREAANAANEHARVIAEREQEHNAKWREARELEEKTNEDMEELRKCLALRNHKRFAHLRGVAHFLINGIRESRETLATDFAEFI